MGKGEDAECRNYCNLEIIKRYTAVCAVSLVREIWNLYCYDTQPE